MRVTDPEEESPKSVRRSATGAACWLRLLPDAELRATIVKALEDEAGRPVPAARRLDITRMTLWRLLKEHGMLAVPSEIAERAARRFRLVG